MYTGGINNILLICIIVRENISFINRVNLKSKSSWEELYNYFYAALCNYSSKITKDKHASEDIVQNMFIKLWDSGIVF